VVAWGVGTLWAALALAAVVEAPSRPAPPFPSARPADWVGAPVTWEGLRGKVVLLEVWTFGCINCVRTIPWVREIRARYEPRGLKVVGVHTPEFEHEHRREEVVAAVKDHGLDYPHLLDNDMAYWRALKNQYWPATYLVDRQGRIRLVQVGEVHSGQDSGRKLEAAIESLLAEP
jgi:thiol-disulfide isomerase/thioredoxin